MAQAHGVLGCVATAEELEELEMEEVAVLARPALPEDDATPSQIKMFEIRDSRFREQDKALRLVKQQQLGVLDAVTRAIVEDINHSVLQINSREINEFLHAEYGEMTHKEMDEARQTWKDMRWHRHEEGLAEFLSRFHEATEFLILHDNAMSEGEKVMTLMKAVSTEAVFLAMGNAAFYGEATDIDDQTLERLMTVYRRTFRDQFAKRHRS